MYSPRGSIVNKFAELARSVSEYDLKNVVCEGARKTTYTNRTDPIDPQLFERKEKQGSAHSIRN
jgi:hypothetical protein